MGHKEFIMKYFAIAVALTGLLATAAYSGSPTCKAQAEQGAQAACKKSQPKARAPERGSGLSAAEKEALDRAHTRTLLDNIDTKLSRQRLGN